MRISFIKIKINYAIIIRANLIKNFKRKDMNIQRKIYLLVGFNIILTMKKFKFCRIVPIY